VGVSDLDVKKGNCMKRISKKKDLTSWVNAIKIEGGRVEGLRQTQKGGGMMLGDA